MTNQPSPLGGSTPWSVSCVRRTMDGQRWYRIIGSDDWEVAYVPFGDRSSEEYRHCTEHARLIAAAPDMVEALEELERAIGAERAGVELEGWMDAVDAVEAAREKARAALSRAREGDQ